MQAGRFVSASEIQAQNAHGLYHCYGGNGLRGYTTTFTHSGKYSLIGRQGALCGNIKQGIGQFHATEHAVVVTPKNRINGDWLFFVLDLLNLNQFATGQAQPGLSVNVLAKLPIAIPSQELEQQKIAYCLSSLDTLITVQSKKLEALKTHKKGLMQALFPSTDQVNT
ncbi:MAG: restriction endonuclease subunit S [Cytophagales bacterium]|nr:restriction endonuclease subunit S [Cytophagales bacterium]